MNEKELKALISLLDDDDLEVARHVEDKIVSLGEQVIPVLEDVWGKSFDSNLQRKIEDIIHEMQFTSLNNKLAAWANSEERDIISGMCLIANYLYPDLEKETVLQEVEQMYYDIWVAFDKNLHPFDQVKIFNSIFFGKLRFSGNTKNFHAPANSMINNVLQTRKGNPISLCVIYMVLANKLDMPVYGVNLPNLFILTYKSKDVQFYINVFNKGLIFSKADIDNYISQLKLNPNDTYYEPCDHWDILVRVLRNLIVSFEKLSDEERATDIRLLLETMHS